MNFFKDFLFLWGLIFVTFFYYPQNVMAQDFGRIAGAASKIKEVSTTDATVAANTSNIAVNTERSVDADEAYRINEAAKAAQKKAEENLVASTVTNALRVFNTQVAQKAAKYAASGFPGQKSAIQVEPFDSILKDAADGAVGDFISNYAKGVTGLDICGGFDALNLVLSLNTLSSDHRATKPSCSFSTLVAAWDITDPAILNKVQLGFSFGSEGNDVFQVLDAVSGALSSREEAEKKKNAEAAKTNAQGGFLDLKDLVTGYVKTPGSLIFETTKDGSVKASSQGYAIVGQVAYDALNVFSSTLLSEVQNIYLRDGLVNLSGLAKKKSRKDQLSRAIKSLKTKQGTGQGLTVGQGVAAQAISARFNSGGVLSQSFGFDFISELLTCPTDAKSRTVYNCALPQKLKTALDKKDGQHLTLEEAVDQKILDPHWPFAFKDAGQRIEPAPLEGIPFTGILKLRRARIVPIGWEIAGRIMSQRSELKTLGQMMAEFSQRGVDGLCNPINPDLGESPYCNLVDPDWVLKPFSYNCRAWRYGQLLQAKSDSRFEYCGDIQDCVVEGENGECLSYGYCTQEKNVWRLGGDQCNPNYEGCAAFTRTVDTDDFFYLRGTVDVSICSRENVGCAWYATSQDKDKNWITNDDKAKLYFDRSITAQTCDANNANCNQFIRFARIRDAATVESIVSKVAANATLGDKYSNYGEVQDLFIKIDKTLPRATNPLLCAREFVGCESFRPKNGDPAVTAIVADGDRCPRECIGYDSYIQEPTFFEVRKFGVDFIPTTAGRCSANNEGCEQFTNLDVPARGGENIENYNRLRQCEKFGSHTKIYFYWEGTETGFQLNRFSLIRGGPLSFTFVNKTGGNTAVTESGEPPKYVKGFADFGLCNKEVFDSKADPDCFELFDETGNRWYRKLSMTVSSPNPDFFAGGIIPFASECHNYRKTLSGELVCRLSSTCSDPAGCGCVAGDLSCRVLVGEDSCSNDSSCISTGGRWAGGECLYLAIPSESVKCNTVGCKQYKGSTARNERNVILDTFEATTINPRWGSFSSTPARSSVSLLFGGSSLKFRHTLSFDLSLQCRLPVQCALKGGCQCITSNGNACNVEQGQTSCVASLVAENRAYVAKFLVKNSTTLPTDVSVKFGSSLSGADLVVGSDRSITTNWKEAVIGPLVFTRRPSPSERLIVEIQTEQTPGNLGPAATDSFIDNFILKEERDSHYLIENSWKTPKTCETNPPLSGGLAQTSMLGCREYVDRFGAGEFLKGFRKLCPSEKVGCEAVVDTYNSDNTRAETFNKGDIAEVTVPVDNVEYIINDPKFYCPRTAKSCSRLGLPDLDNKAEVRLCRLASVCTLDNGCICDDAVTGESCISAKGKSDCSLVKEFFVLNNPNNYSQTLCKFDELWCEEFSDENRLAYFKDPKNKTCEYKAIPGTLPLSFAWFKQGDNTPNPGECVCEFKPVFTEAERTCTLPAACAADGGCTCSKSTEIIKSISCLVNKGESTCLVNDLKAWFEKGSGVMNPGKCRALDPRRDQIWANVCPENQNQCTGFIESSSCMFRKGVCFLPTKETTITGEKGVPKKVAIPENCSSSTESFNASVSWPDDGAAASGGCFCDNGPTECFIRPGSTFCSTEPDWYSFRTDRRDRFDADNKPLAERVLIGSNIYKPNVALNKLGAVYEIDSTCERYYYLNNDRLNKSACNGAVDWIGECVLFNDTSNPNLTFTSADSLAVPPIDSTVGSAPVKACNPNNNSVNSPRCDSNLVLKVIRDRTCGQWAQCATSMRRWDKDQKQFTDVCFGLGTCRQADPDVPTQCRQWVRDALDAEPLSTAFYQGRYKEANQNTWAVNDYSGYALFNRFALEYFRQKDYSGFAEISKADFKLTAFKKILWNRGCADDNACGTAGGGNLKYACKGQSGDTIASCEAQCQTDADCRLVGQISDFGPIISPVCRVFTGPGGLKTGRCFADVGLDARSVTARKECRGYPESNSPLNYHKDHVEFTNSLAAGKQDFGFERWKSDEFDSVNFGFIDNVSVDCHYQKVTYGEHALYYDVNPPAKSAPQPVVFQKGSLTSTGASTDSTPVERDTQTLYLGWKGYCLEYDANRRINASDEDRACITWWPVDNLRGELDIAEMPLSAIWQAPVGGQYYCLDTKSIEVRQTYTPWANNCQHGSGFCGQETLQYGGKYRAQLLGSDDGDESCLLYPEPNTQSKFPYVFDSTDGLQFMEVGLKTCSLWVQVQAEPTIGSKVSENIVYSTRIRATPKTFRTYWDGFQLNLGNGSFYQQNVQDISSQNTIQSGFMPDGSIPIKNTISAPAFGASCFVKGGCSNLASVNELPISIVSSSVPMAINKAPQWKGGGSEDTYCYTYGTSNVRIPPVIGFLGGLSDEDGVPTTYAPGYAIEDNRNRECNNSHPDCQQNRDQRDFSHKKAIMSVMSELGRFGGAPLNSTQGDVSGGKITLGQIYRKIYGVYNAEGQAISSSSEFLGSRDSFTPAPPVIRPVQLVIGADARATRVELKKDGFVSINDIPTGEIKGIRFFPTTLSFYGYNANGEQLPIRQVSINWGDGSEELILDGFFKNHKQNCNRYCYKSIEDNRINPSSALKACSFHFECGKDSSRPENQCIPDNFGDHTDACVEESDNESGAFIFTHVYNCQDINDPNYNPARLACEFRPTVKIKDNWGMQTTGQFDGVVVITP
ncbi:MAG: Uncharacterized protein G01um101418_429 [Parcubacteria group bacterium Gr01-1014_18]|nr:MAG: Uncharacterized protein Greene041636_474 [Parcubacteria group bacterium Greene0416_36]TSC81016.1 MAG: Uncharacterized protein G01um101418_429 [Parcubacteria group bacterium Gr01-1014_18]TSC98938.1 MAG: Uncharacterized protein Greene101420_450 [Parcubacteria group bacterium Greene1014_20]TSD06770.1 MAG: Uncharacterized protein Greene07142_691 [Parcubacteria group bacterium Greene0714_2]